MTPAQDDDRELTRPAPSGGEAPPELATGHAGDDEMLRQIAARTSLELPRDWEHFLLVPDEATADKAAGPLMDAGWEVSVVPPDLQTPAWCVLAEQRAVSLTPALVQAARQHFEALASQLPGAEYDGWQASVDFDDDLQAPIPGVDG